jgi:hypothetical protein
MKILVPLPFWPPKTSPVTPLCGAQIINAFGEGKKAKREFEGFYNLVMAAVDKYRDGVCVHACS